MRHPYADFVHEVARPARYLGGEYLSVVKDPGATDASVVLAFPDTYEVGMSHLGTKILYGLLNRHPRIACERAFTPWLDMEAQLRARGLPLVSLETARPLAAFDVVGVSLQYELSYTNVLTLLDLGGLPRRAADRRDGDPLVLAGGPTATHPEPVAPFFDAFYLGEAEERLPALVLEWAALRRAGHPRLDSLAELAARFPLYVPELYDAAEDPATGLVVVGRPRDPRAPARVRRVWVDDLDAHPFPVDGPVPYAEAVFDRAGVEIARGCTEGCRFCQAGMIYRPARERSPDAILDALLGSVTRGGYDETALTSLSTADYSCLDPLVRTAMARLRERKVALGLSSLRAYGLGDELLDELATVRATGLTFAPEAGTGRLRDVINKNVTDADLRETAERVFSRGWSRLKLYFMIGLPTEEEADLRAIVATASEILRIGRRLVGRAAEVAVSVSSHVPKPHTPFQWCRMDGLEELARKQQLLQDAAVAARPSVRVRCHDRGVSHVEAILARGDRRCADAIERAWQDGARFDGWEDQFDLARWLRAFAAAAVEPERALAAMPVGARLPWDHLDVGLRPGFLEDEHRRALRGRSLPPCGKPGGVRAHPTNLTDAEAAAGRRLVCSHCGLDCDLARLRAGRHDRLRAIGAIEPPAPAAPAPDAQARRRPRPQLAQGDGTRWRLGYTKLGCAAFISHLDVSRLLGRVLRRAEVPLVYSLGFHPRPAFSFGPALSLGVPSLGEIVDVRLDADPDPEELRARLERAAPAGVRFPRVRRLEPHEPGVSRVVKIAEVALRPRPDGGAAWDGVRLAELVARAAVDPTLTLAVSDGDRARALAAALDWPDAPALLVARVGFAGGAPAVRLADLAERAGVPGAAVARLALLGGGPDGATFDPLDPPPPRAPSAPREAPPDPAADGPDGADRAPAAPVEGDA